MIRDSLLRLVELFFAVSAREYLHAGKWLRHNLVLRARKAAHSARNRDVSAALCALAQRRRQTRHSCTSRPRTSVTYFLTPTPKRVACLNEDITNVQ